MANEEENESYFTVQYIIIYNIIIMFISEKKSKLMSTN